MSLLALPPRLFDKIAPCPVSGCWLWVGATNPNGYAKVWRVDQVLGAHRAIYELLVGLIPDGYELHHRCRVRSCVNPAHVEALTVPDHAATRRRETCQRGHLMEGDNLMVAGGDRRCRACHRASHLRSMRAYTARHRDAINARVRARRAARAQA